MIIKKSTKLSNGKELDIQFPIKLRDRNGNVVYIEDSNGYWAKREYDENDNEIYYENSYGGWCKWEYDKNGNIIYFINSYGSIQDNRPKVKELTVKDIEKIVGHPVKIVK